MEPFSCRRPINIRPFRWRRGFGQFAKGQAIIWPLIAACSLVRRHPGTPFVPEYIIPQFLLQWVQREKGLDGIRYFSTKLAAMDRAQNRAFNFVFPVRHKAPRGICGGLQNSFALTPPVSWPMLQSWQPKIMGAQLPAPGAFDLAEGFPVAYSDTEFFALEPSSKEASLLSKLLGDSVVDIGGTLQWPYTRTNGSSSRIVICTSFQSYC